MRWRRRKPAPVPPPPGNRWEPFTNGELKDLLSALQLGHGVRVFMGQYEDKFQIQREIEAELGRRNDVPVRLRAL